MTFAVATTTVHRREDVVALLETVRSHQRDTDLSVISMIAGATRAAAWRRDMQQIDAVDATLASWQTVASYVLTVCQERDKTSIYSYLQVAADLVEPTRRLIAEMNSDDTFTIVAEGDAFPCAAPAPRLLSPTPSPGAISMATDAILAALGMRR